MGADYDLWLRLSKEFDIEYIPEPLVLYAVHPHRISTNRESLIRGWRPDSRTCHRF